MPYPESFLLAWVLGRGWKFIVTYQCDAPFSGGIDTLIARALDWSHRIFIKRASVTVTSSEDYAEHSRLKKVLAENGPAVVPVTGHDRAGGEPVYAVPGRRLIGFMGRPTFEKGVNVLLDAMESFPLDDVSLLFAGPVTGLTERLGYDPDHLQNLTESGRILSVGFLEEHEIRDFFASLDLYVHPSINSFEAFGIVQIEAMSAGIPVVASDIPGVRTAVWATGFGEITRAGDPADLVRGLVKALNETYDAGRARRVLDDIYLPPKPQDDYLRLYERVVADRGRATDIGGKRTPHRLA
jgi:glycosyltransferase involved in cell wall biosynthesis